MIYHSERPAKTREIAERFAKSLKKGDWVGLSGELGAGKTTFVQGLARGLRIDPAFSVSSPSFTLVNHYEGKGASLVHVDLYRIEREKEIESLGLDDYQEGIVVIEWAERLKRPFDYRVNFRFGGKEGERVIEIV